MASHSQADGGQTSSTSPSDAAIPSADAALLQSELGREALRRSGILEPDLYPRAAAGFDRDDGELMMMQRYHEYERRRAHKWTLLREEHKRLSLEAERKSRASEVSSASAAESGAQRQDRLRRAQELAMRQVLDRQARILERDVEAEEIRQRMEARLDRAQANREELAAERELRRARLQAYRESLESLHKQRLALHRTHTSRASSAPRSRRGTDDGDEAGAHLAGSVSPTSRRRSYKSHKAAVARAVSRREAVWQDRDRALLDRLKVKENRMKARRESEAAAEEENRARRRAIAERVQLRRELHGVASDSRNYARLVKQLERNDARLGRSASTGRLELEEEAARRRKNERERAEHAAAARRQAAAASLAQKRAQLAKKLEEKASARAAEDASQAAERARKEYHKKEKARLRVFSARVAAHQAEERARRNIENKLEKAEQKRQKQAAAAAVRFDVLRRREAAADNQEMRLRASLDKEERIRRSIASKERLYQERQSQKAEEAQILRAEREALQRREEKLREQLSNNATARDLVASASLIAKGPLAGARPGHQRPPRPPPSPRPVQVHTLIDAPPRRRPGSVPRGRPTSTPGRAAPKVSAASGSAGIGVNSMAAIEALRQQQNEALIRLLEEEQAREIEREALLARTDGTDRERLRKIFEVERANAEEETMGLAAHHELELAREMARLGMTR